MMHSQRALTLLGLFMACLMVAVWSEAVSSQPKHSPSAATESGTVSGKISSIGDGSFSIDVRKSQDLVTMQFFIDDSTRITGKLNVGATVTVEYRTSGNDNIAVRVIVQPSKPD
jgi:hypothetical protein